MARCATELTDVSFPTEDRYDIVGSISKKIKIYTQVRLIKRSLLSFFLSFFLLERETLLRENWKSWRHRNSLGYRSMTRWSLSWALMLTEKYLPVHTGYRRNSDSLRSNRDPWHNGLMIPIETKIPPKLAIFPIEKRRKKKKYSRLIQYF